MLFTPGDLAAYPGGPAGLSIEQYAILHDLTQDVMVEALGPVAGWTVEQAARARRIGLRIAARAYANPRGYQSETIEGEYSYRHGAAAAAGIWLTAEDRAELLGPADTGSRVSSVRLVAYGDG